MNNCACYEASYPTIKNWFLETYPKIAEFRIKEDATNQENKPGVDENVAEESVEAA